MITYAQLLHHSKARNKNKKKIKKNKIRILKCYKERVFILDGNYYESRYHHQRRLQVLLNLQNVIFFSQGFLGVAARRAVYLEELPLLLGSSTSHHSTELLVVDPTIIICINFRYYFFDRCVIAHSIFFHGRL